MNQSKSLNYETWEFITLTTIRPKVTENNSNQQITIESQMSEEQRCPYSIAHSETKNFQHKKSEILLGTNCLKRPSRDSCTCTLTHQTSCTTTTIMFGCISCIQSLTLPTSALYFCYMHCICPTSQPLDLALHHIAFGSLLVATLSPAFSSLNIHTCMFWLLL